MKSALLFTLCLASYAAYVKADCDPNTVYTMTQCVKIRTETRDSFCITKPDEIDKCNCVYDTLIRDCYDLCPTEPTILTEKQQLESVMQQQCDAANLDPDAIPPNFYNEVQATNDQFNNPDSTVSQGDTVNNQQSTLTEEDYAGSAVETAKVCFTLVIAALASLLL